MPILGKARQQEWETVWKTLSGMRALFAGDPEELGLNTLLDNIQQFILEQFRKADAGKPAVWYNIGYGPPLIYALGDVNNVPLAEMSALCSIIGDQADTEALIDASEAAGYSAECCSADKAGSAPWSRACIPSLAASWASTPPATHRSPPSRPWPSLETGSRSFPLTRPLTMTSAP